MLKLKSVLFYSVFIISFVNFGQKVSVQKRDLFIEDFITVVKKHDQQGIINRLHPEYQKEHLKKFLKNNKTQLVNELFSGQLVKSTEYTSFQLNEIVEMEVFEILDVSDEDIELWDITFLVKSSDRAAYCSVQLKSSKKLFGFKLGFIGSYG